MGYRVTGGRTRCSLAAALLIVLYLGCNADDAPFVDIRTDATRLALVASAEPLKIVLFSYLQQPHLGWTLGGKIGMD